MIWIIITLWANIVAFVLIAILNLWIAIDSTTKEDRRTYTALTITKLLMAMANAIALCFTHL